MTKPVLRKKFQPINRHSRELRKTILAMLERGISQNKISRQLDKSLGTIGYHVACLRKAGLYKG
jgi:DNA-binding NarL/FixJ family response regulator